MDQSDVFLSYRRKDVDFVKKVDQALKASGREVWVDWEDIPPGVAGFTDEIQRGIENANAFIAILSPAYLESEYCLMELREALRLNKRIVPIVYQKFDPLPPPEGIGHINWIYFTPHAGQANTFEESFPKVTEALEADFEHVRQHTRLQVRAMEWEKRKQDKSLTLRGKDLTDAEQFIAQGSAKSPAPTALHGEYILISRREAVRTQRMILGGVVAALIVSILLGIVAVFQWRAANEARKIAEENQRQAMAQQAASQAKLWQLQPDQLYISSVLALHSLDLSPSNEALLVLRENLRMLPVPLVGFSPAEQGADLTDFKLSPDEKFLLSANGTSKVGLWDAHTGTDLGGLEHTDEISLVYFSPNDSWAATAGASGKVYIWDLTDRKLLKTLEPGSAQAKNQPVASLAVSPNGALLAAGSQGSLATVWDTKTWKALPSLPADAAVTALAFKPDSQQLAVSSQSGQTRVWDFKSRAYQAEFNQKNEIFVTAYSQDGNMLAMASSDKTALLVDPASGQQLGLFLHGDWVESLAFSPDGRLLATVADDNLVRVYETKTGTELLRMRNNSFVLYLDISADGQWLATSNADGVVRVWNIHNGQEFLRIPLSGRGGPLSFNADTSLLYTTSRDGHLQAWDTRSLSAVAGVFNSKEYVRAAKFSPDGSQIVVAADDGQVRMVRVQDILSKSPNISTRVVYQLEKFGFFSYLSFNKLLSQIDVVSDYGIALIPWSADGGTVPPPILYPAESGDRFIRGHLSKDRKTLVAITDDHALLFIDTATGKLQKRLQMDFPIFVAKFHPAGKFLVIGSTDHLWLLNLENGEKTSIDQPGNIQALVFSDSDDYMVSGSSLGQAWIWQGDFESDPLTHKSTCSVNGEIVDLEISPEGQQLSIATSLGIVSIGGFDCQEMSRLAHPLPVKRFEYSDDGRYLMTVSGSLITFWDLQKVPQIPDADLKSEVCSRLPRNLTEDEWQDLHINGDYYPICPDLPSTP